MSAGKIGRRQKQRRHSNFQSARLAERAEPPAGARPKGLMQKATSAARREAIPGADRSDRAREILVGLKAPATRGEGGS
jgi:hypothetical protein